MLSFSSGKKFTKGPNPISIGAEQSPERGSVSVPECNRVFHICELKIPKYIEYEEVQGKGSYKSNQSLMTILFNPSTELSTKCPTRYRTWHFFNNFTTKEDIATKLEADLSHCVRNVNEKERTPVQISLQYLHWCQNY